MHHPPAANRCDGSRDTSGHGERAHFVRSDECDSLVGQNQAIVGVDETPGVGEFDLVDETPRLFIDANGIKWEFS